MGDENSMQGKKAALLWSTLHSIGDTLEEKLLLKFNETEYLFWLNFIICIFVSVFSFFGSIEMSILSFLVVTFYAFAMVGGDFCYAKAIQTLPIGLANLIDSGSLFLVLLCDIFLGYIQPKFIFLVLFAIFFVSIYIFSYETNKMKNEITNKKIDLKNIFILITSTIFYASEPYFLKLATSKGGNEYGINLVFYLVSISIYYVFLRCERKKNNIEKIKQSEKRNFFGTILLLGAIYSVTTILSTLAYASGTPIIITLIMKLQLFIVVIISVIRKTDKMNLKKIISLLVGVLCIIAMTFMS